MRGNESPRSATRTWWRRSSPCPPRGPGGSIARTLLATLTAARSARVTLVSAPTGYGKTMLLAAWCAERRDAVAWLSLGATENDPALFTRYVIGAFRSAGLDVGARAEKLLQVPGHGAVVPMRSLVNDLALGAMPATLVLDDYQLIDEPLCHAALQALIDPAPPSLNLVIATRADPPLGLGALRAARLVASSVKRSFASPSRRRPSCSSSARACASTPARSPASRRAPKDGPPACTSPPSGCAAPRPAMPTHAGSPATTAISPTT